MTIFLSCLVGILVALFMVMLVRSQRLHKLLIAREAELAAATQELEAAHRHWEGECARIHSEAQSAASHAQNLIDQNVVELKREAERIRAHYESEARKSQEAAESLVAKTLEELEPLRKFQAMHDAEAEIKQVLADALTEAESLRNDARNLLAHTRSETVAERAIAAQRVRELRDQADALLNQAIRDAGRIVEQANKRAEEIGGDAYTALREKQLLEQAVKAIRNVIDGYGDRYVIPTHSLLDDLAAEFGHTAAGETLKSARDQSRRMVEQGLAAACDYVESNRKATAIRFVADAFNGRVDAILTRSKHDNYGTLEQEIRDAFSLVNLNGQAFRNARIIPAYLDARLAELKWAVVLHELRLKEREEQRRIQQQMRDEEKARREYERAIQEAAKEEEGIRKAMEKARLEVERAGTQEREKFEAQLVELNRRLADAEAKNQRALSMAQRTRSGHVYVISNIGSFGEEIFKIGMTRRLEPFDRVKELGDASVPFDFDVHAMIYSMDAPALERMLHEQFDDLRINKVNYRKEFFRLPVGRIKEFVASKGLEAAFTLIAEAREYRETQALEKMTPEDRQKYPLRQDSRNDEQSEE